MDPVRFDRFVLALAISPSRRVIVKALGGGTLSAALGLLAGREAAACIRKGARCGTGHGRCCGTLECCENNRGVGRCRALLTDPRHCGACGLHCAAGAGCLHGACTCDPFNNQCPTEVDGQCTCGAVAGPVFRAACVDRNSACDLDKPCESNADCPPRSVCLLGCADPPAPQPNRCSNPCIPV
jgi:hypothetical protein